MSQKMIFVSGVSRAAWPGTPIPGRQSGERAGSRLARTLSVPVRGFTRPARGAHGRMTDRTGREGQYQLESRRSGGIWPLRVKRSVKPSAQPTLVRTQDLPPPAKTAPGLRKRDPAGRFLLVTPCIRVRHCGSMRSSGYGPIADSVRAERAVRITARFADPRPFCPVTPGTRTARLTDVPDIPAGFGSSPCCSP